MVRAAATAQSRVGNLTLGFFPGLIVGPLRAGIADFTAQSPQVRLRMVEALPGELHRQLNERAVDIMVVALMPKLDSKMLVQERFWDERLFLALPAHHPYAQEKSLGWDDIAEIPLILKASHVELVAYRTLLDRIDRQVHLEQHDVSCTTLLDMVGLGMGATIVFASSILPHRGVAFLPIAEDNATVGIDAVWPKDDRNPLRHRLLSQIREHKDDAMADPFGPIPPSTAPAPDRDRPTHARGRQDGW